MLDILRLRLEMRRGFLAAQHRGDAREHPLGLGGILLDHGVRGGCVFIRRHSCVGTLGTLRRSFALVHRGETVLTLLLVCGRHGDHPERSGH